MSAYDPFRKSSTRFCRDAQRRLLGQMLARPVDLKSAARQKPLLRVAELLGLIS